MSVRRLTNDAGFTLIELMVVMILTGVLLALGAFSFVNYQRAAEERGSTQQLVSVLRSASEQAVSEGRTYCVSLSNATPASGNHSYSLWRRACTSAAGGTLVNTWNTQSTRVSFAPTVTVASPAPACAAGRACIYFYPRGTATPASLVMSSSARSKQYTVRVEGLTARVYFS
jgi:type II secretion system protein H